ncbi:metabotropic glutamate receptor-like [Liolophura sinensis]|uniref:metabotropic glutamate receptor-like n=1 Tax=Liolophura sinensis TaxID=3198878 RepID=UPI003158BB0C
METCGLRFRFLAVFMVISEATGEFLIPGIPDKRYQQLGDVNLGGIFPIYNYHKHLPCGSSLRSTSILQYVEAMVYAVNAVNQRSDILPNVTLGFVILDDCKKPSTALSQALRFIPRAAEGNDCGPSVSNSSTSTQNYTENFDVVGVVGSMLSSTSISVAEVLGVFHVPQISYASSSDELSDRAKYPYFLRVVTPDSYQIQSMIDLIVYYNWTYISTVHSAGSYGETGIKLLQSLARERGICIATSEVVDHYFKDADNDKVIKELLSHYEVKVVVLFTGPENARELVASAKRLGAIGKFVWLGGDAWATRLSTFGSHKDGTLGAFTFKAYSEYVKNFDAYFEELTPLSVPSNPWFGEFWEKIFGCSLTDQGALCDNNLSLKTSTHSSISSIGSVIDAVSTFAVAIDELLADKCPDMTAAEARSCIVGSDLLMYLKNVSFLGESGLVSFDASGEFIGRYMIEQVQLVDNEIVQRHVATWNSKSHEITFDQNYTVQWSLSERLGEHESDIPESVCSKPCKYGEFYIQRELPCCWDCRRCRENEITVYNATGCLQCPPFTWPEQTTFRACEPITPTMLLWQDATSLLLLTLAGFGMLGALVVFCFYIFHNNTRLIKASSRELCYLMLLGILIGYLTVFGLVAPATTRTKCVVVQFGFNCGLIGIYAPLLTRTNRIYRIFNAGKKSTKRPPLVSPRAQTAIALSLIAVQLCMTITSAVLEQPSPKLTMPVATEKFVELSCELAQYGFLAFLIYNILLVLLCSAFAFKTRKLPDNFNESRFISMCVYTTLVVWIAFIPTYFTTAREYQKTVLLSLALIVNATVALAFLYLPKIYATLHFHDAPGNGGRRGCARNGISGLSTMTSSRIQPTSVYSTQNNETDVSALQS